MYVFVHFHFSHAYIGSIYSGINEYLYLDNLRSVEYNYKSLQ